jgi:Cu/Ag efflux protein CusF
MTIRLQLKIQTKKQKQPMKKTPGYSVLCSALLAASLCVASAQDKSAAPTAAPMGREEAVLVTATASVEAIDLATREVTLLGPLGNTVTFTVDQRVKRLNEVKVGDFVRADYYVSVAAEVRSPTPAEEKNPLVVLDAAGKAPPGTSPAAGGLRRFRVVTTIEGLDRPTQTVTVKGPMGRYLTARVADPSRLTQVRIGDTIVITYTEALAISLEKEKKKNAG